MSQASNAYVPVTSDGPVKYMDCGKTKNCPYAHKVCGDRICENCYQEWKR